MIDLGIVRKGRDCETAGGCHEWYNADNVNSACYHCRVIREGRLWDKPNDVNLNVLQSTSNDFKEQTSN
jgi:hypothetical protein